LLATDFSHYFDDLNSSHEFGYPKEEQNYWRLLQKKYQFNPQNTLFIDDNITVLKSAQTFGIGHLLAISQPDLSKGDVDCTPFHGLKDFQSIMLNSQQTTL